MKASPNSMQFNHPTISAALLLPIFMKRFSPNAMQVSMFRVEHLSELFGRIYLFTGFQSNESGSSLEWESKTYSSESMNTEETTTKTNAWFSESEIFIWTNTTVFKSFKDQHRKLIPLDHFDHCFLYIQKTMLWTIWYLVIELFASVILFQASLTWLKITERYSFMTSSYQVCFIGLRCCQTRVDKFLLILLQTDYNEYWLCW